jgi:hypothetical protein
MQRLRQLHSDKSQCVIELIHSKWQIELTLIRVDGSVISLVSMHEVTLDEAKNLAARGLSQQNGGHCCTENCGDWEEF